MRYMIVSALIVVVYLAGAVYTFDACRPVLTRYVLQDGSLTATRRIYPCGLHPTHAAPFWPITLVFKAFDGVNIDKVETVQVGS
jgi:hypothetical protein